MNKPWDILVELAATDSKNEKQAIIAREAAAKNDDFFAGLRFTFDNMLTFGVKKVPERTGSDGPGLSFTAFVTLANKLIKRELTGGAAADEIVKYMDQATNAEWNGWYRRILVKDLKAGFSESTVNKVCEKSFPKYAVPVFECQLAKDCVDEEGNVDESELRGKKIIDTKLDGMRVITIAYPNGQVDQFSRNGKELVNFGVIREQISTVMLASKLEEPVVIDAEVMSKNFQDLMKQARRKTDVQADDSVLNLFDLLTLREFQSGKSTFKQRQRLEMLHNWFNKHAESMPNVSVLGYEIVDLDTKTGQERLYEINRLALAAKAEGIMIKDPDAVYECKRSRNWLKMKPFIEESLTVVDVEEGKPESNFVGTMGALVCEEVIDGKPVKVNCGSGYSIQLRAQIWARHTGKPVTWQKKVKGAWVTMTELPDGGPIVGLLAEVRADALTKSQDGDTWSMRFPRFKTFRGTVAGEKL